MKARQDHAGSSQQISQEHHGRTNEVVEMKTFGNRPPCLDQSRKKHLAISRLGTSLWGNASAGVERQSRLSLLFSCISPDDFKLDQTLKVVVFCYRWGRNKNLLT